MPKRKGSAVIAVNDWTSYYNVRMNHLNIVAGREIVVKVKPSPHISTKRFKSLGVDKRECLLPHERNEASDILQ